MKIYSIDDKELLDVKVTSAAVHEEEMMKSNLVRLSWKSNVKINLAVGTYIIPYEDGLKYRLIEPYEPTQDSEDTFTYQPEFQHPIMWLSKVPFTYATKNTLGEDVVQQEWEYTGLTLNILKYAVDFINTTFGFTDKEKFVLTPLGNIDTNVSLSFSSTDVLSALSAIANGCTENKCEYHLLWEHKALYFGQVSINLEETIPTLKVGENVGKASVTQSKGGYYNVFYPQGSTRNMSVKAASGENVSTGIRLGLDKTKYPNGEIDTRDNANEPKQTFAMTFDEVYPHVDCYVYNVRKRTRYLLDDENKKVVSEYNADGSVKSYKTYTVWYMRLAYPLTKQISGKTPIAVTNEKLNGVTQTLYWYDYEVDDKQIIDGYTLCGSFSVNTNEGALGSTLVAQPSNGDGFELKYHKIAETIPANATSGDSGVTILKGDYEIVFVNQNDTIIPTNEKEGLIPRGDKTPSVKGNIVILYNIAMGDDEVTAAQDELERKTLAEIAYRHSDLNNYAFTAYPNVFAKNNPHLYIGQRVKYDDGNGYSYTTRVLKLTTNLDYDICQEITVGNSTIKGSQAQLKEDVQGLISGTISVGSGLSYEQVVNICKNYTSSRYLSKTHDDETKHRLTMGAAHVKGNAKVDGQTVTDDIHSADSGGDASMTGRGWTLKNVTDETGTYSVLAVDNIVVRKKMEAAELEIHRKTYVGAQQIASDWGHKILRVDPVDYNAETGEITAIGLTLFTLPVTIDGVQRMVAFVGRQLSATETRVELLGDGKGILNQELEMTANAFKVYFCESDGTASVEDDLVVGTMGQCQEFNVKKRVTHHFTNSYYWGVCLAHGVEQNVLIGDKATPCVWGVFSHSTALLTLTSEVSGGKFSCYGMEQSGCTFPVVGDDMVAFGCADPWQDSDRSNAIITASKDGQRSAPSVIAYSNIGRMRGGQLVGTLTSDATPAAYASISEQYSLPTDKADSRLDFRISKPKGNVFKGDMYFRGDDGTMQPIGATYMLSANKSVVENGGLLTVSVYKVVAGKAEPMKAYDFKNSGLQLSLTRSSGSSANVTSAYPTISWSTLSNNNSNVKNVVIKLLKDNKILDTTSVALGEKAVAQTEEWRLIPVREQATIDYDIDKDQYANYAESGETGDDTLDKVFKKTGNISLQYNILHRKSDLMQLFTSMSGTPVGYYLAVTEFGAKDAIIASYSSDGGDVGATHLHDSLMFTDTSTDAASVSRITVMLYDKDSNALDRREVSMNLGTNGVFEMNKKFLAYTYYGTDGKKGTQYLNQHVSTMEGNYTSLEQRVTTAEGGIEDNKQQITETADEYERKLTRETKDRNDAISDLESKTYQRADSIGAGIRKGLQSVGFNMDSSTWTVNTWGNKFAWYATEADANKGTNAKMWFDTNTDTLHVKGYVEATGGKIGNLELVSDGDATFERSKDSSGKYIEKSRSVMSSRSITFYEQHSDGRFSIVDPVSWIIKIQSDADHPGKGLQSVKMEGYSYMIPGHSVELGDHTTAKNWADMTGMGIGYSTNGRAIAKVFQSGTGGLAMVCVAYGMINADGTFDAEKQTQMALDYNCTVERVNKIDTGWYVCTLRQKPHGLYTVFVRARVSSGGIVRYATLGAVSFYTFTVMTSDDATRNDCDFEYFVVSFGGY